MQVKSKRVQFIIDNPHLTNAELCSELGIEPKFLEAIKTHNNLTGNHSHWTQEEEDYLRKHYAKKDREMISVKLRRSMYAIQKKANSLGLYKKRSGARV